MPKPAHNVIGPLVRQFRAEAGLSQDQLAAKCGVLGWDISRGTLAKVEAQVRCVTDAELFVLSRALQLTSEQLFPKQAVVVAALRG